MLTITIILLRRERVSDMNIFTTILARHCVNNLRLVHTHSLASSDEIFVSGERIGRERGEKGGYGLETQT